MKSGMDECIARFWLVNGQLLEKLQVGLMLQRIKNAGAECEKGMFDYCSFYDRPTVA